MDNWSIDWLTVGMIVVGWAISTIIVLAFFAGAFTLSKRNEDEKS